MASENMQSVQPADVSKEMVAYLLTVSILGGADYGKSWTSSAGIPIIHGFSKDDVLGTYAECLRTVQRGRTEAEHGDVVGRRR